MKNIEKLAPLTQKELDGFYESAKNTMTIEETANLVDTIIQKMEKLPELKETAASWNTMEKMLWIVSEAYCIGTVQGIQSAYTVFADDMNSED